MALLEQPSSVVLLHHHVSVCKSALDAGRRIIRFLPREDHVAPRPCVSRGELIKDNIGHVWCVLIAPTTFFCRAMQNCSIPSLPVIGLLKRSRIASAVNR